jgi:hypothetical protein
MNSFIVAFVVSFFFVVVKFIEMRFVAKENYPLKLLVKESLFVFFSVIVGQFVVEQANPNDLLSKMQDTNIPPEVFVTNPDF